jgi:protein-tyrosine phosphatase
MIMRWKDLFKKDDEPLMPFDFGWIGTDIHSHLIPGIDDGSPSMEESIKLIKGMISLGYTKLITTPHVMSDFYQNTSESILSALNNLKKIVENEQIIVELGAAAEYYMDYEFVAKMTKHELLTFGANYLLVECSFIEPLRNLDEVIFEIQVNGYKPVLAHPERYIFWHNDLKYLHQLKERDVLFQLNILSLTGVYSPDVERVSKYLVENKMYDFIGTDLHHSKHLDLFKQLQFKQTFNDKLKQLPILNSYL